MKSLLFGLVGTGGFAREVMPLVAHSLYEALGQDALKAKLVFVETTPQADKVNGISVISEQEFIERAGKKYFNIAIADSVTRKAIAERLQPHAEPLPIRAAQHVNLVENTIADGSIFCSHTTITANCRVGKFFHGNIYSYIGHDSVIGDYVTFAPNVHCNGNVHIHDHAYIGAGAIIKQGSKDSPLIIGQGAVIGMGAVVTKSVAAYSVVVGNPAQPMKKTLK